MKFTTDDKYLYMYLITQEIHEHAAIKMHTLQQCLTPEDLFISHLLPLPLLSLQSLQGGDILCREVYNQQLY